MGTSDVSGGDIEMTGSVDTFRRLRLARLLAVTLLASPMAACHLLTSSQPVPPPPPPPPPPPTVSGPTTTDLPNCPGDPRCDQAR